MRAVPVVVLALLVVASNLAPLDTAYGKRQRLRGTVRVAHGKAPKHWKQVTPWATATPAPAPVSTPTPTPTPGSTLPPPNPRSVSVNSTEYRFTLSQTTVSAGPVRVQFDNSRAEDPHALGIDGPDADYWSFSEVPSGGVTQQTVVLRPGRHELFCPVPGHLDLGMRAVLTVK